MKLTSKTPYEIRLELLQLANNILTAKHLAIASSDARTKHGGEMFVMTSPTSEEVIVEAEKLNAFISKAHPHS